MQKHRDLYAGDRKLYCRKLHGVMSQSIELGHNDYAITVWKRAASCAPLYGRNYLVLLKYALKMLFRRLKRA